MGIKGLLGFCECKGCKKRMDFEMDIIATLPDGKKIKKVRRFCKDHAMEAVKGGILKSVTIEDTINFD